MRNKDGDARGRKRAAFPHSSDTLHLGSSHTQIKKTKTKISVVHKQKSTINKMERKCARAHQKAGISARGAENPEEFLASFFAPSWRQEIGTDPTACEHRAQLRWNKKGESYTSSLPGCNRGHSLFTRPPLPPFFFIKYININTCSARSSGALPLNEDGMTIGE